MNWPPVSRISSVCLLIGVVAVYPSITTAAEGPDPDRSSVVFLAQARTRGPRPKPAQVVQFGVPADQVLAEQRSQRVARSRPPAAIKTAKTAGDQSLDYYRGQKNQGADEATTTEDAPPELRISDSTGKFGELTPLDALESQRVTTLKSPFAFENPEPGRVVAPTTLNRWVAIKANVRAVPVVGERVAPNEADRHAEQNTAMPIPSSQPERVVEPAIPLHHLSSSVPKLRIEAKGPQQILVGDPTKYEISIQNDCFSVAKGVYVRVALPDQVDVVAAETTGGHVERLHAGDSVRELAWTFEEIPPHERHNFELTIRPTAVQDVNLDIAWSLLPQSQSLKIATLEPRLEVVLSGPEEFIVGDFSRYMVDVANAGSGPARDVYVSLAADSGYEKNVPLGTILPGTSRSIQVELAELPQGTVNLQATASGANGISGTAQQTIQVKQPKLDLAGFGPATRVVGAKVDYQLRVRNSGTCVARNLKLTAQLPESVRWVDLPPITSRKVDSLVFDIGDLKANEERTFTIVGELTTAGEASSFFEVEDDRGNRASCQLRTVADPVADIQLTVVPSAPQIAVGEKVTYLVKLENHGSCSAEDVLLEASFAAGLKPLAVTGGQAEIKNGQVFLQPLSDLRPADSVLYRITAQVARAGAHSYRIQAVSDDRQNHQAYEGMTKAYTLSAAHRQSDHERRTSLQR